MLTVPFLTELDSRAAVKGSRDPLGIQQLWTRLGRHVVGNLTTVSNTVRDFTTLLLGLHFAEQVAQDLGPGTELATFLKWEQMAAYARAVVNKDWGFRGENRVKRALSESDRRVTLSDDRAYQILGNQKIYGLWGLYTMPGRASGLVEGDPPRPTPPARELIDKLYIPILADGGGRNARRILEKLRLKTCRLDLQNGDGALIRAVGHTLKLRLHAKEKEFFRTHLLFGGPEDTTHGCQQQLAELLTETLQQRDFVWSPAIVGHLIKSALKNGEPWHPLAHRLQRIRTAESVFAPIAGLFSHLLGLHGKPIGSIVARLRSEWGSGLRTVTATDFRELRAEIGQGDAASGDRWLAVADAVSRGEYENLLDLLIDQNKAVMLTRGGAAWIDIGNKGLGFRSVLQICKYPEVYSCIGEANAKRYVGDHMPIVTEELWQRVQQVRESRRASKHRRAKHEYLFSRLIACGHCGCALVGERKKNRYTYYHCTYYRGKCPEPYVREEVLEHKFADEFRRMLFDDEVLQWLRDSLLAIHEDATRFRDEAIARLRADHDRLQKRMDAMYVDKLDGKVGARFFDQKSAEWREEQRAIGRAMSDHDRANQCYMKDGIALLELSSQAAGSFEQWPAGEKRRWLEFVLSNCTWKDGELTAVFRQPFDLIADGAAVCGALTTAGTSADDLCQLKLPR